MLIMIDIDETICTHDNTDKSVARQYDKGVPIIENIAKANRLYDEGHTIVYWTARGAQTGIDWRDVTEQQLSLWGCKYHSLRLDKPHYDLYIDDKVINTKDWK